MADVGLQSFATAVLKGLGAPTTSQNVRAIVGWAKAEGGHFHNDARYNPLNTTQPLPGAGNTGSQGNVKVYKDWSQGVQATVKTLKNGRYQPILSALAKGDSAEAVANAIGQTPWGTSGGLVRATIGATPALKAANGIVPVGSSKTAALPARVKTVTTPGVDNSAVRRSLLASYVTGGSGGDLINTAVQILGAPDTPGSSTTVKVPGSSPATVPSPAVGKGGMGHTANAAVSWAEQQIGKIPESAGPNRGKRLNGIEARFGYPNGGAPWCAMFTSLAVTRGGAPLSARTASVANVRAQAQSGAGGYHKGFVDPAHAKSGDLILFGNDHVGMVVKNTGRGLVMVAGNDSDQVSQRTVAYGSGDIVRPKYGAR